MTNTADSVQVNTGAMLASGASLGAISLACDLIRYVWWPDQTPFSFDVDDLCERLEAAAPGRGWNKWRLRRYRAWAQTFFRETAQDRWAPVGDYYLAPSRTTARSQHSMANARPLRQ